MLNPDHFFLLVCLKQVSKLLKREKKREKLFSFFFIEDGHKETHQKTRTSLITNKQINKHENLTEPYYFKTMEICLLHWAQNQHKINQSNGFSTAVEQLPPNLVGMGSNSSGFLFLQAKSFLITQPP